MIPCEFLNVNMSVRRKDRPSRQFGQYIIHYYHLSGCYPLPSALQLPLRPDQQAEAGAGRGVEPDPGLRGPRPRGHRVQQRRDGVQVSRDIIDWPQSV